MVYIVECKPDKTLLKKLTAVTEKNIIHGANKAEVLKALLRSHNSKGIVDEDPGSTQPRILQKFIRKKVMENCKIKIALDSKRKNKLIILCPRLEDWILAAAREANIDLNRYSLPNDATRLHEEINIKVNKLEKLIEELLRVRKNRIRILRKVLLEK